jgi:NAD(P)-dependent dehydrogenase (short-subunit alcohol dehydrogenase family)
MNHTFSLAGRRALVTGSSRGIGAAIAVALAEAGADVVVNYAGSRDAALEVVDKIKSLGRRSVALEADLASPEAPKKLIESTLEALGGIDILVSNVAIQHAEPWQNVSRDHFDHQVTVNWRSAFELIQLSAPAMLERKWGRIVTIGSVQEAKPHPEMVVYSALKAAQTLMVQNFAKQFAPHGVTVNNLAPGVINTDRSRSRLTDPTYIERVLSWIPAGTIGEPEDCAGAALLLCSDAGRYITGQNLFVDGGMSL